MGEVLRKYRRPLPCQCLGFFTEDPFDAKAIGS